MKLIKKPNDEEFHANEPVLANLLPDDGLLLEHMIANLKSTKEFLLSLSEDKLMYRYAKEKWTIKEVLIHLIDMERIYTYRALRFARNDQTELPGFDDKQYVYHSGAIDRDILSLLKELEAVRYSTIAMVEGFDEKALTRSGTINGKPVSVRALLYHIAGHELHHIKIIKERYLT
jgi:uncharacterized damage-inducible protein DinB